MNPLYLDENNNKKKVQIDWAGWLKDGDTISSVSWKTENNTNVISISDTSETSTVATAFITATVYDTELHVKATMTTDNAIPEVDSRSILVNYFSAA